VFVFIALVLPSLLKRSGARQSRCETDAMLEISGAVKTFNAARRTRCARCAASISPSTRSFVIVIGTNGSGSRRCHAVAGGSRSTRTIELDGTESLRLARAPPRRLIGRVFQNPFQRHRAVDVDRRESRAGGAPRAAARARLGALPVDARRIPRSRSPLNMRLEERLDNPIGSLSGGQRQALTLLMASWLKPKLLLLDEHTAALDPKSADQVIQLSDDIVARDRLTTLMVTHSMQQAAQMGRSPGHDAPRFRDSRLPRRRRSSGCAPTICSTDSRRSAAPSSSTSRRPTCCGGSTSDRQSWRLSRLR
jgi:putative ABC transport system ATP-binding protein